jgi:hypothetical protein
MFQRIQTLFLIVALFACAACFFTPFWVFTGGNYSVNVDVYQVKQYMEGAKYDIIGTIPVIVIISVMSLLTLVSLYYFRNRPLQMKINGYNLLFSVILIGTLYLWIPYIVVDKLPDAKYDWQYGLIFPLIAFLGIIFANRFIKKDEKLVKSADRLR